MKYFDPDRWSLEEAGYAAAVSIKGETVFTKYHGLAEMEHQIPITEDTLFHVASVSKQLTVYLVMLYAQRGIVDLDECISVYDPQFPKFSKTITLRHLIHHTSGLRDQWELLVISGWLRDDVVTQRQVLKLLRRQKVLNFDPGEKWCYCNMSYTEMAYILEKLSGMSFDKLCAKEIFEPLGMKKSMINMDYRNVIADRTFSYQDSAERKLQRAVLNYSCYGPTSLFTNGRDLLLWGEHLLSLRKKDPELYALMSTSMKLKDGSDTGYAGGLIRKKFLGYDTLEHGGWDAGYRASFVMVPELDAVSVCLSNHGNFKPEGYAKFFLKEALGSNCEDTFVQEMNEYIKSAESLDGIDICAHYQNELDQFFRIYREADRYMILMTGMPSLPLKETGSGVYTIEGTQMLFLPKKEQLIVIYPYNIQVARKIEEDAEKQSLKEFVGRYYCPELQVTYDMKVGDELLLYHNKLEDISLIPVAFAKDTFITKMKEGQISATIEFKRNREQITGFFLQGSRVKNIWFYKEH